jgi:hypothetical protein
MRALLLLVVTSLLVVGAGGLDFGLSTVDVTDTPRRLDAADLDGDGDVDLMVLEQTSGSTYTVQVLTNGHGQLVPGWSGAGPTSSPGSAIWDLDLADTDSDGDTDVVYVVPFGATVQRFNDGLGHFDAAGGSVPTYSFQFEHEIADMDGDGNVDIVFYEPDIFFDTYFGTLKGFGNGIFAWGYSEPIFLSADMENPRRIALGDITGDGLLDAAFTSPVSGLRVFKGKPSATGSSLPDWGLPQLVYTKPCADAVMADLVGNGRLHLVASVPSLDAVAVIRLGAGGAFGAARMFGAGPAPGAMVAADLDLDGAEDVIVTNPTNGTVTVLQSTGTGGLKPPVRIDVGANPSDIVAADLDNDGDVDLAVTCAVAGHVALVFNETP